MTDPKNEEARESFEGLPQEIRAAFLAAEGGHFAAWEQPKLLVDEMRVGLKSLR